MDELSSGQELWLQEVESVDYWGPTFRAIYESGCQDDFLKRLERRIEEHDSEIEKMCNHHYQGFIDSVRDLLGVREDASSLNADVVDIDKEMRASGAKVAEKAQDLVKARKVEKNIAATIESLSLCLPVLQTFAKLNKQMNEKRYHPALKTLEQLEHTYLPRIANYRFSKQMRASIPSLRESIKEAAMCDLKDFLEKVRKFSPKIGEHAMRATAQKMNLSPLLGSAAYEGQSESVHETEEDLSAEDWVDFSPVYRCLHIRTVLGERDDFEKYYRKQRRQQATLTLQPPPNMHESVEGYRSFFHGIVGFFVCEDHVLNTGNGLVSRGHLDEVWAMASSRILSTLQASAGYCTDSGFMLKVKNLMLLFSHTLQGYGFSSDKMYVLLQELRENYNEVLMQKWVGNFRDIFDADNYHPIQVTTQSEFDDIHDQFAYQLDESLVTAPFPKHFPFSPMVLKVYKELKDFIKACVQFSEDLHLSPGEIDESVRKSTNVLLTRTLSGCLNTLIRKDRLSLIQLIQIYINTYYLEETNIHLEKFIAEITGTSMDATHIARLQGRSIFKDIRAESEEEIQEKLISKIDEFIELASYDWLMGEPEGLSSSWLSDLLAFLKSVFQSFTNLPSELAKHLCMSACTHLNKALKSMLLDENIKAISHGVLKQMDLDLIQCEMFAEGGSELIKGLDGGTLLMCFADMRQLLELFVLWDWANYLADVGSPTSKYLRVTPQAALTVFEKLKEADSKNSNVFSSITMKSDQRDKKRLFDEVHKKLKGLVLRPGTIGQQ